MNTDRPAHRTALLLGTIALLCANLPYLLGYLWTPPGASFTGLTYNADDGAVYLAWIRQATEGHLFFVNRFTTEPQQGLLVNLFFFLLGTVGRILHLSPPVVYAGARVVFGGLMLWSLWRLVTVVLTDKRAQVFAFALLCFASGFGFGSDFDPALAFEQPIDRWQPEAITFLTLYYTPLFSAALALMAVFAASVFRAEQSGKLRDVVPACVAGFLLGNFHSYDILQLFAFALVYRIVTDILRKRVDVAGYVRLLVVGLAMLPTAGYQLYAITNEAVFNARVFATSTLSPSLIWVLMGFGLPLLLAIAAPFVAGGERGKLAPDALRFLCVWAVVAVLIAYVPVSFQRKLLMGAHVPICLLAGATLAAVSEKLSGSLPLLTSVAAVLITMPSNIRFLVSDVSRLPINAGTTQYRPYLAKDEANALRFLRETAKLGDAVLVCPDMTAHRVGATPLLPYLGVYIPAYSSASAYAAHWSETADFAKKNGAQFRFFSQSTTDTDREAFLAANPAVRYVLYDRQVSAGLTTAKGELITNGQTGEPLYPGGVDWMVAAPPFLESVYESGDVRVFQVRR